MKNHHASLYAAQYVLRFTRSLITIIIINKKTKCSGWEWRSTPVPNNGRKMTRRRTVYPLHETGARGTRRRLCVRPYRGKRDPSAAADLSVYRSQLNDAHTTVVVYAYVRSCVTFCRAHGVYKRAYNTAKFVY